MIILISKGAVRIMAIIAPPAVEIVPTKLWARFYAQAGLKTLPLMGKVPATAHGYRDAAEDYPFPDGVVNIGIRPPKGTVVLDVDPRNGGDETMLELVCKHRTLLPDTLTAITGGGGIHFWFRYGGPIATAKLGPGVDVKHGATGYVVAPPSIHPITGYRYRWARWTVELAPLPTYMRSMLAAPARRRVPSAARGSDRTTTDGLVATVANAVEGNRNNALYWAACRAFDGDADATCAELVATAVGNGLSEREARAAVQSARQACRR